MGEPDLVQRLRPLGCHLTARQVAETYRYTGGQGPAWAAVANTIGAALARHCERQAPAPEPAQLAWFEGATRWLRG